MSKQKYTAFILGASGLIGSELLQLLLKSERYDLVYSVSRTELPFSDSRLVQIIADYSTIESKIKDLKVDHLFCCIGTTNKQTPDQQEYFKIDHDYPLLVAKLLKNQGCETIAIVSSIGANSNASGFYLKLKGQVEKSITELAFQSTNIFRPSLLLGKRKDKRITENIAKLTFPLLNLFLVGKLKDYRSIKSFIVASAMMQLAISSKPGVHIYQTEEIKQNA